MNRQVHLDCVGGLLIIHMVLGHIFQFAGLTDCLFYHWMDYLFFFMPWFFFKSGMFYNEKNSIKKIAMGGGKKLLLQCGIWSIIGQVILAFLKIVTDEFDFYSFVKGAVVVLVYDGAVPGNGALWFLVSLYIVSVMYGALRKYIRCGLIIALSVVSVSLLFEFDVHRPVWMVTAASGCLFYALGDYLRNYQYDRRLLIISIIFYSAVSFTNLSVVGFRTMYLLEGSFYLWLPASVSGIILINNLFKKIPECGLLTFIGKNSMIFYVTHWCMLLVAQITNVVLGNTNPWVYFALLLSVVLISWSVISIRINKYNS